MSASSKVISPSKLIIIFFFISKSWKLIIVERVSAFDMGRN